jgi:hypothetical protein
MLRAHLAITDDPADQAWIRQRIDQVMGKLAFGDCTRLGSVGAVELEWTTRAANCSGIGEGTQLVGQTE